MASFNPDSVTVSDFKAYFNRHFPYQPAGVPTSLEYVQDNDITIAFGQAKISFNPTIWDTVDNARIAYLFLTAHYLCMDLRMAQSGLNSTGTYSMSSKSVGSVSASYNIPDVYSRSPLLNYLTSTEFGLKYIALLYPRTVGAMGLVRGTTTDA